MHTIRVTREIDAPAAAVWAVLDDFGAVANYNPALETSRILDGPATGIGAVRECVLEDGQRIEEAIVDYRDGSGYTINVVDLDDLPLRSNRIELALDPVDDGRTTVTVIGTFTPKYGPIGWVLAKTVMGSQFRRTFENLLAGLDAYVRTGELVGESTEQHVADAH